MSYFPCTQVNKFNIDTRPDGSVAQFYSDLSLRDFDGKELLRKTISVNDPFRYGGVTMYQTDWALAAVTVRLVEQPSTDGSAAQAGQLLQQLQSQAEQQQAEAAGLQVPSSSSNTRLPQRAFNLPFASLEGRPGIPQGSKLYATFLPLELPPEDGRPPRGISRKWLWCVGMCKCTPPPSRPRRACRWSLMSADGRPPRGISCEWLWTVRTCRCTALPPPPLPTGGGDASRWPPPRGFSCDCCGVWVCFIVLLYTPPRARGNLVQADGCPPWRQCC
jgi:hypothetical protein